MLKRKMLEERLLAGGDPEVDIGFTLLYSIQSGISYRYITTSLLYSLNHAPFMLATRESRSDLVLSRPKLRTDRGGLSFSEYVSDRSYFRDTFFFMRNSGGLLAGADEGKWMNPRAME